MLSSKLNNLAPTNEIPPFFFPVNEKKNGGEAENNLFFTYVFFYICPLCCFAVPGFFGTTVLPRQSKLSVDFSSLFTVISVQEKNPISVKII